MKPILLTAAFLSLSAYSTFAASEEICYEDVATPATMSCNDNETKSADFSLGCTTTPATTKKVEVPCPEKEKGRWVNIKAATYSVSVKAPRYDPPNSIPGTSHAEVCASVGLKPANLDGNVCAAGERRPMIGGRWEEINYKYGKKGDGNKFDGGNRPQVISSSSGCSGRDRDNGDCNNNGTTTFRVSYFCYDSWTKNKNYTKQDVAVAWYCE